MARLYSSKLKIVYFWNTVESKPRETNKKMANMWEFNFNRRPHIKSNLSVLGEETYKKMLASYQNVDHLFQLECNQIEGPKNKEKNLKLGQKK